MKEFNNLKNGNQCSPGKNSLGSRHTCYALEQEDIRHNLLQENTKKNDLIKLFPLVRFEGDNFPQSSKIIGKKHNKFVFYI